MKPTVLVVSCEHAVNTVPKEYQHLFENKDAVLASHRGLDLGSRVIAEHLQQNLHCECTLATVTRLLIDCNRSLHHVRCFSQYSRALPQDEKQTIINQYYLPYRNKVTKAIQQHIDNGKQVLHVSVHSFTPVLNNKHRKASIGLLYDSDRHAEKEVAREWHHLIRQETPDYKIRMNYPYSGKSDGFTSTLRGVYDEQDYLGLELECNQGLLIQHDTLQAMAAVITRSLSQLLQLLN